MASKQKQPIGIELAKRNLITENDINRALDYQKNNPGKKLRRYYKYIRSL